MREPILRKSVKEKERLKMKTSLNVSKGNSVRIILIAPERLTKKEKSSMITTKNPKCSNQGH